MKLHPYPPVCQSNLPYCISHCPPNHLIDLCVPTWQRDLECYVVCHQDCSITILIHFLLLSHHLAWQWFLWTWLFPNQTLDYWFFHPISGRSITWTAVQDSCLCWSRWGTVYLLVVNTLRLHHSKCVIISNIDETTPHQAILVTNDTYHYISFLAMPPWNNDVFSYILVAKRCGKPAINLPRSQKQWLVCN